MKSRRSICIASIAALMLFGAVPNALARNTWYVDGVNGNDNNDCQSRQHACKTISNAISLTLPGDSIFVAPATYHEGLVVPFNLNIIGSDAKTTIVDAGVVFGQALVIGSEPKVPVTVSRMTFRGAAGLVDSGGGIYNCFGTLTVIDSIVTGNRIRGGNGIFGYGGGIYNCPSSTLTLINTTVSDNSAEIGGGICNGGALTIINSTFSGNVARHRGGAIGNYGTLSITNSTFSGNSSGSSGFAGGILNGGLFQSTGTLAINNSTLGGNTADEGRGGGIFNVKGSTVVLQNSIVANNAGGNCHGVITSGGYNLSSDDSCEFTGPGDLNTTDPNLGPLQSNGGPTRTMALLPGSLAIDSGNPSGCTDDRAHLLKTDQRGQPRPDKEDTGGCDRGAYESQQD
jgi:predicted outer membrane repeat protein